MSAPQPSPAEQPAVVVTPSALLLLVVAAVFFAVGLVAGVLLTRGGDGLDADALEILVRRAVADGVSQAEVDRFALVDDDPSLGPRNAPVVMVEFSAYGCPFCRQFHAETLPSILENYGDVLRYVYRDMPTVNPEVSFPAAMAAGCANDQDRFWEYHDALFVEQDRLSDQHLRTIARRLGLDLADFEDCMTSRRHYDEVNGDFFDGTMAGVTTTPNFIINGELYTGAQPYAFFADLIERELFKAGITRGG